MKLFVVSFVNLFDNEPKIKFVRVESEADALDAVLRTQGHEELPIGVEALEAYAFDCDCLIKAAEVPHD